MSGWRGFETVNFAMATLMISVNSCPPYVRQRHYDLCFATLKGLVHTW